jgi:hypothetical protein
LARNRVQRPTEGDIAFELYRVDARYSTARTAIRWFFAVLIVGAIGWALQPFAGKNTAVTFFLSFVADLKFVFSVTVALGAAGWALIERGLRYHKTKYLQDRIKKLETEIDPQRSTSGLTRTGRTNPKDRSR